MYRAFSLPLSSYALMYEISSKSVRKITSSIIIYIILIEFIVRGHFFWIVMEGLSWSLALSSFFNKSRDGMSALSSRIAPFVSGNGALSSLHWSFLQETTFAMIFATTLCSMYTCLIAISQFLFFTLCTIFD